MKEDFQTRVNRFVHDIMKGYTPTANGEKIIHEPIWGSVVFHPWEVRLIDSPLFQRLRGINQVGLAESTYPAARHTRFEHSIGTAAIASRMMERLYANAKQRPDVAQVIGEEEIRLLRLTALLHDVGHCPYSHLSEAVYGRMPEFIAARNEVIAQHDYAVAPSPHEVFSYLIIVSDAFVSFFHKHIRYPGVTTRGEARDLLQKAANLIIGAVNTDGDGVRYSYLTSVINGNFDADKLDYTQRDSYSAGIALTYGVERFLLKLVICKTQDKNGTDYKLGIPSDALSTVEELIFNRSMLYHYMYRHQKILAAEAQMRDAIYALVRVGQIQHPCDFLLLTNQDLGALYQSRKIPFAADDARGKTLKSLMDAFSRRTLLKRALELTPDSFGEYQLPQKTLSQTATALEEADQEGKIALLKGFLEQWQRQTLFPQGIARYIAFLNACTTEEYIEERRRIACRIAEAYTAAGKTVDFDAFDLALSFQPPLKSDLSLTVVDKRGNPIPNHDAIGRIQRWTETLNLSKWRGYLFVAPHVDRHLAGEVFRKYLDERCGKDVDAEL